MDTLVKLRIEQGDPAYVNLLAPFYYKLGDYLATFIELNTDEFGNIKPLPSDCQDDESCAESEDEEQEGDIDPNEESKDEVPSLVDSEPVIKDINESQINTIQA